MSEKFELPKSKGVVYWPIGTGDSTTIVIKPQEIIMQIDLRHLAKAEGDENPEWPIVDHLVECLPKLDGRPFLSAFVLTHPDRDHIQGFEELLKRVKIGEIWHTPKVFRDLEKNEILCDDAKAFRKEAHRRRKAILDSGGEVGSGDRLRVIGHDNLLSEEDYVDLPETCKSRPGELVTLVDGEDVSESFEAFIHAPFKEDQAKDRNNTSLSLNVSLIDKDKRAQFFFFGDREYLTIKRIFEVTEQHQENVKYLNWNVMLSAHHCSKSVMFWKGEGDDEATFRQDIMDYFEEYSQNGYIIASSLSDFSDEEGKNPPHKKARKKYEAIVDAGNFLCTHEYPSVDDPKPIVFTIDSDGGFGFDDTRKKSPGPAVLAIAIESARGATKPPRTQTEFGAS